MLLSILLNWVILAVSFWLVAAILPGMQVRSFGAAFFVAAIYGVLNALIGWLLAGILVVATLGLLLIDFLRLWIVGAVLLKITDALTDRLTLRNFFPTTLLASALMAVLGALGSRLVAAIL